MRYFRGTVLFFSVQENKWALPEFRISNNGVISLNCFENGKPRVLSSEINAKRRSRGILDCNGSHRLLATTSSKRTDMPSAKVSSCS